MMGYLSGMVVGSPRNGATLCSLVDALHRQASMALVLADAEFDSERNHQHSRQILQAQIVIPAQ
jgi:hypothetical protein